MAAFRTIISRIVIASVFVLFLIGIIIFARGYRLDLQQKTLSSTGILAISSSPKAAKVYVNGELKGVTDINLPLPPGTYTVEIKKDGYANYAETLVLRGELVEAIDPILFPINPSLTPLTNLGIVKAVQVDQSDRLILFSDNGVPEKDGIYLFEAGKRTLSFFPPLKPLLLKSAVSAQVDFKKSSVLFSYDFKQAIVEFSLPDETTLSYLISLDQENQQAFDVSTSKNTLLEAWEKERQKERLKLAEALPKEIRKIATDSFQIVSLSPDQTKVLYKSKKDTTLPLVIKPPLIASNQTKEERNIQKEGLYVYDKREDKNFRVGGKNSPDILWYFDSKRLVFKEGNTIAIILYDGQNKQVVYSGPIEEGFFASTSDGKVLIMANLNPQFNKLPDVYEVGIR
ncbi:PEGA domain-containing protein [Candidatus Roizmanbacteria bacterium]|nr:PEGA domain-containing protein [Candidatus Roizmanbacteria bacterium]